MRHVRRIAQAVRHAPGLERAEGLWNLLRNPYHQLINSSGQGVEVNIGRILSVRIPPEYCGCDFENYEPEPMAATVTWLQQHPTALLLDIGCSIGVYAVAGLAAASSVEVIAFDSDLESLQAARRMCHYYDGNRLQLVYGFAADKHESKYDLGVANLKTAELIASNSITGDPGSTRYVCIEGNIDQTIPTHSLDGLFAGISLNRPILLKCDVEGAELLVLRGAEKLLRTGSPQLLISVHPSALPQYGHSVNEVKDYLMAAGYTSRLLAIDHEEHWWCEKL